MPDFVALSPRDEAPDMVEQVWMVLITVLNCSLETSAVEQEQYLNMDSPVD